MKGIIGAGIFVGTVVLVLKANGIENIESIGYWLSLLVIIVSGSLFARLNR